MKYVLSIFGILLMLMSCGQVSKSERQKVDSLCLQSYRVRYTDIDSCERLAKEAYEAAEHYDDGRAKAMNRLAYVRYQRMDYDGTLDLLDSVYQLSSNHITLLCANVMRMKVCQRIGDGQGFYEARSQARRHLKRIAEEMEFVKGIDRSDYEYAWSEYHIISSTYYYYQEQDSLAKAEMAAMMPEIEATEDTTQLLYYYYMLGSGGLLDGTYDKVAVDEFRYLMDCYTLARRAGVIYFEANALQSLAEHLMTPYDRELIYEEEYDALLLLLGQHLSWMPETEEPTDSLLPLALAQHALSCFKEYDDLFQTACVYRTIGSLAAYNGDYDAALEALENALSCVNKHHLLYYPECEEGVCNDTLSLFKESYGQCISTERRWIENSKVNTVPEWMAGIRQQISLLYSAMNLKAASDYNRDIYLDILESTSQNREMESRMRELQEENAVQHRLLWAAAGLFTLLLIFIVLFVLRLKRHEGIVKGNDGKTNARILRGDKARVESLRDELEEANENCEVSRMRIAQHKTRNSEKRAKVSLVQAVVPFLDRIINEVKRMKRQGSAEPAQLQYVSELSDQIMDYNDILTEWIKMESGKLSLQISTIQLSSLFAILERGHFAYDQKGVKLIVRPTDLSVKADEALTMFMLNTLADNARKFTPEGGSVTIDATATEEYVELSVTDTGCGLKEEDIDLILNNKAYDSSKIGLTESGSANKGFGFGLMNCKGIIEKYKKTANLFRVCCFGIESEVGKGSRFFFRLPRVMTMLMAFFMLASGVYGQQTPFAYGTKGDNFMLDARHYCELAMESNMAGDCEKALNYVDTALYAFNPELPLYDKTEFSVFEPLELQAIKHGEDWDFLLLMEIRNQAAIASLALHEMEMYTYNNRICINLHKIHNQDATLPYYCDQLAKTESASRQLTAVLFILSVITIFLVYMFFRGKKRIAENIAADLQAQIDQTNDRLSHYRFEENRLYVQNQVLDNCLSTIKHESMYYPSRIKQLTGLPNYVSELDELTAYYKELYTLLSGQAERQVEQMNYRRERISVKEFCKLAESEFKAVAKKYNPESNLLIESGVGDDVRVLVDSTLLREMLHQLALYVYTTFPTASDLQLRLTQSDHNIKCELLCSSMNYSDEEAHNLFYPDAHRIPLLIVKQIIRDFDAMNNNPGLRLVAERDRIWWTFSFVFL